MLSSPLPQPSPLSPTFTLTPPSSPRSPTFNSVPLTPTFASTSLSPLSQLNRTHTYPRLRIRALTFGPGSAHAGAQIPSRNVNGSADAPVANVPTQLTEGRGSGSTEGHAGADEQPTRRARSPPPKSPSRARSVEKDKDRERSPSRARITEGRNGASHSLPLCAPSHFLSARRFIFILCA
jgi:hypothetical protein